MTKQEQICTCDAGVILACPQHGTENTERAQVIVNQDDPDK